MMGNLSPLQLIFSLEKGTGKMVQRGSGGIKRLKKNLTFSFKCNTNTMIANRIMPTTTVTVTQGIHSPGRKNSSRFQASPSFADGRMTTFEFGMTPSMLM